MPDIERAAHATWAIPVPFRGNPIKFTYSYLVQGKGQAVLIDAGAADDAGRRALRNAFDHIGFDIRTLMGIVITHCHIDHWALADEIAGQSGAWVALGAAEWAWLQTVGDDERTIPAIRVRLERDWGVPPERSEQIAATDDYGEYRRYRTPDFLLQHGEPIPLPGRVLTTVATPGHTPGHLSVLDEGRQLLFSGDHVLPRITPNVSLNPFGAIDPLREYQESLGFLDHLAVQQVLPAHEYRFTGLRSRNDAIRRSIGEHLERVSAIFAAQPDATVWRVAELLPWSRRWADYDPLQQRLALGETAAYLRNLGALPDALPRVRPETPASP